MPLNARSMTPKLYALDSPAKRGGRTIGSPIDLKPTQENSPRTNRLRSSIERTAS